MEEWMGASFGGGGKGSNKKSGRRGNWLICKMNKSRKLNIKILGNYSTVNRLKGNDKFD